MTTRQSLQDRIGRTVSRMRQRPERFLRGRTGIHARVAIITIIEEEWQAVVDQEPKFERNMLANQPYRYRNSLGNGVYDVVLARVGRSTNTICSNFVHRVAEYLRPEFIILCGIAGGIEDRWRAEPGNVVIADHVEGYEQQKKTEHGTFIDRVALDQPSYFTMQRVVERVRHDQRWRNRICAVRPEPGDSFLVDGNIIAGEKLLGNRRSAVQREILSTYNNAKAVDMESYGLARAVYELRATRHYNVHYSVIRSISDTVGTTLPGREEKDLSAKELAASEVQEAKTNQAMRDKWRDYAASAAAAFTLEMVDEILAVTAGDKNIRT